MDVHDNHFFWLVAYGCRFRSVAQFCMPLISIEVRYCAQINWPSILYGFFFHKNEIYFVLACHHSVYAYIFCMCKRVDSETSWKETIATKAINRLKQCLFIKKKEKKNYWTFDWVAVIFMCFVFFFQADKDDLINDAAAIAESIQPKGNTLSSTNVVTPVPFLLRHTLREYQVSNMQQPIGNITLTLHLYDDNPFYRPSEFRKTITIFVMVFHLLFGWIRTRHLSDFSFFFSSNFILIFFLLQTNNCNWNVWNDY